MRYGPEHKEQAKARLVAAVGRGFRKNGFGGIGVDGLAKEAQMTSGAFYGHFSSKEAAFGEAVLAGMDELKAGVLFLRETHGQNWLHEFVAFYLTKRRLCDLSESCALQSLAPEVQRADVGIKAGFETSAKEVATAIADGLTGGTVSERLDKAWSIMAILSGGVTLARSVQSAAVATAIADAIRKSTMLIGDGNGE
jgi:TetR/AcrR family transcriptional regulator, transcriptional repressor for nem operon